MTYSLPPGSIPLRQQYQLDATRCSKAGAWGGDGGRLYTQNKTALEMLWRGFGVILKPLLYSWLHCKHTSLQEQAHTWVHQWLQIALSQLYKYSDSQGQNQNWNLVFSDREMTQQTREGTALIENLIWLPVPMSR